MIAGVDIETAGLDATKFIMGTLWAEGWKKPEIYNNKRKLWGRIIELGYKEQKRGKTLNLYGHHHAFDFYGYADTKNTNIVWFCERPFIVALKAPRLDDPTRKQEIIKFLDTLAIFKMPLKTLGEKIGLQKLEMPEELITENTEITPELLMKITPYCIRDTEIVLKSMIELKKRLKQNGIMLKRLYTINQIAINYLINYIRKQENTDFILENKTEGKIWQTEHAERIHEAYRGGRVEAWQTGKIKNVSYIDCNSLYPKATIDIDFPDLRTEKLIEKPEVVNFDKIGITKCMVKNNNCELGILPVRTQTGSYYPKKGKYIIGTWTNLELKKAFREGYELIDVEWTVQWEKAERNPLKQYMLDMYKLKNESKDELDYYFYKMMMNSALGKLAQTKTTQEIIIDNVEKADEYLQHNWEIIKGIDLNYMYKKDTSKGFKKKYYCPIIPTLVNAQARIYMYDHYKQIPKKDLIYTDTDSIMYKDQKISIIISKKLGDFKKEHNKETAIIYGKKSYMIGEEAKVSGFRKRDMTQEEFEKGQIINKKMITIRTTNNIEECGKFKEEKRNLKEQRTNHEKIKEMFEEQPIHIDCNIQEINYFMEHISSIL